MEEIIKISNLNDFMFCPASIYYHGMYEGLERSIYQEIDQIRGTASHEKVDKSEYSSKKNILQGIDVYSSTYNIIGKIDVYDEDKQLLIERKHLIKHVYDGYIFQLYAQYFALKDQGYKIKKMRLHSYSTNKNYEVPLPEDNLPMFKKFEELLVQIRSFNLDGFEQKNIDKCKRCIYAPLCVNGGERLC